MKSLVLKSCPKQMKMGVYETLCPQHMLAASKDNLETRCQGQERGIIQ